MRLQLSHIQVIKKVKITLRRVMQESFQHGSAAEIPPRHITEYFSHYTIKAEMLLPGKIFKLGSHQGLYLKELKFLPKSIDILSLKGFFLPL